MVHVGRQPLFDPTGEVIGYELLFRSAPQALDAAQRGPYATSQVIVNAFTSFDVRELAGDRLCFINVTRDFLVGELSLPFAPGQVVLEVLETVEVDDEVVAGVTKLAAEGYRIALDDFVWGLGHEQLLSLASYVKLDFRETPREQLEAIARECRLRGDAVLVAEKVESEADLALGRRIGCTIFQGYVLERPKVVSAATLGASRLHRVKLMTVLNDPSIGLDQVVSLVRSDAGLSLRLLRAVNAADSGVARRVSSVRDAVVLLGSVRVRQWVTLMLLADVADAREDHTSATLVRARTCQSLADRLGVSADAAFTVGLLAGVAESLAVAPHVLAGQLPLTDDVVAALTRRTGALGRILEAVVAYEGSDPERPRGVAGPYLVHDYLDAIGWTNRTLAALAAAGEAAG